MIEDLINNIKEHPKTYLNGMEQLKMKDNSVIYNILVTDNTYKVNPYQLKLNFNNKGDEKE